MFPVQSSPPISAPSRHFPLVVPRRTLVGLAVIGVGALALLALVATHIRQGQADLDYATIVRALVAPEQTPEHLVVRHARLPRAVIGMLVGAAFGVSGVVLQAVTRNPLASPDTLGVNAGAFLFVTAVAVGLPLPAGISSGTVAFAGGLATGAVVYVLASGSAATPVRLALAGMTVTLAFWALSKTLLILDEVSTSGLIFWGSGSLLQRDWGGVTYAWPRLALAGGAIWLLARGLDILALGDEAARALGLRIGAVRLIATVLAVYLPAVAIAVSGPIPFVGLVAAHLVRLLGVVGHRWAVPAAAAWGAVLLLAADVVARAVTRGSVEIPAGIVTAMAGAPFFVWLARRSRRASRGSGTVAATRAPRARPAVPFAAALGLIGALLVAAVLLGVRLGDVTLSLDQILGSRPGGGTLADSVIWGTRAPRLLVAAATGAMLAASGVVVQAVVRNPLGAPEVLGVTSGASLAAVAFLLAVPNAPVAVLPVAAVVGGFAAFGVVYLVAWRGGTDPARLALVGVAVSAFAAATTNLLLVGSGEPASAALVWLSGSTYARDWADLSRLLPWLVLLLPSALLLSRWLDLFALGDDAPRGLGMPLERARLLALSVGVALTAGAVASVGAISFVGLIAPHAARLLVGTRARRLLPFAAVLGAILVTAADTVGRTLIAPREVPSGLVTALIGAPYFLWLLWTMGGRRVRTTA